MWVIEKIDRHLFVALIIYCLPVAVCVWIGLFFYGLWNFKKGTDHGSSADRKGKAP